MGIRQSPAKPIGVKPPDTRVNKRAMFMGKESCNNLIDQASALLAVTAQLDYLKIIQHDPAEVQKLNSLLGDLGVGAPAIAQSSNDYYADDSKASAPVNTDESSESTQQEDMRANRQMAILEQLTQEGFANRLGRVYNSRSEERSMEFRKVPHRKSLPEFDMIVSADYSPGAGVHGIIITDYHVMSVYLASPEEQNEWEVLKRKPYDNMVEMAEYVTLLAAGFDLP